MPRFKAILVFTGAGLIAASLAMMPGLLARYDKDHADGIMLCFKCIIGVHRLCCSRCACGRHGVFLTIMGSLLPIPIIGMFYGVYKWTAAHTAGSVDTRFITRLESASESPLGQIAMIPLLAWIAHSAPAHLKAAFFAVMA